MTYVNDPGEARNLHFHAPSLIHNEIYDIFPVSLEMHFPVKPHKVIGIGI